MMIVGIKKIRLGCFVSSRTWVAEDAKKLQRITLQDTICNASNTQQDILNEPVALNSGSSSIYLDLY